MVLLFPFSFLKMHKVWLPNCALVLLSVFKLEWNSSSFPRLHFLEPVVKEAHIGSYSLMIQSIQANLPILVCRSHFQDGQSTLSGAACRSPKPRAALYWGVSGGAGKGEMNAAKSSRFSMFQYFSLSFDSLAMFRLTWTTINIYPGYPFLEWKNLSHRATSA